MRCVLITAFGSPVEPEVKRNFAIVSGRTALKAVRTAERSVFVVKAVKAVAAPVFISKKSSRSRADNRSPQRA